MAQSPTLPSTEFRGDCIVRFGREERAPESRLAYANRRNDRHKPPLRIARVSPSSPFSYFASLAPIQKSFESLMPGHSDKSLATRYVALLRGINVGGSNQVGMAQLKQTFERLGFTDVRTVLASGNVVFRAGEKDLAKLAKRTELAIRADFGMRIKVVLRDQKSMVKLVKAIPPSWVNDKEMKCDVMFLGEEVDNKTVLKQLPVDPAIEDVKYVPGAIIWRIDRDKASTSRMYRIVGTELYQQMTIRNPNTVRKLCELMLET